MVSRDFVQVLHFCSLCIWVWLAWSKQFISKCHYFKKNPKAQRSCPKVENQTLTSVELSEIRGDAATHTGRCFKHDKPTQLSITCAMSLKNPPLPLRWKNKRDIIRYISTGITLRWLTLTHFGSHQLKMHMAVGKGEWRAQFCSMGQRSEHLHK